MTYPSEQAERFNVRLPDGLRERLRASAAENRRSMNAELVFHLDRALPLHIHRAATGEGVGNRAPAAADRTDALQGVNSSTRY